jgi:hypothetical protein
VPEHSDGIAEELERQLQIILSPAAVIARRGLAQRQHTLEQAQRESEQAARAARGQIETERRLAAAQLQPVFDEAWWETATPAEIAGMWEQANSWREPDGREHPPSTFDKAVDRIDHELGERAGLDANQLQTLAAIQELVETEHQAAAEQPGRAGGSTLEFDSAERRDRLRARLAGAGVPESAIDARTLADIAQGHEPAQAVTQTADPSARSRPRPGRPAQRDRRHQRVAR